MRPIPCDISVEYVVDDKVAFNLVMELLIVEKNFTSQPFWKIAL